MRDRRRSLELDIDSFLAARSYQVRISRQGQRACYSTHGERLKKADNDALDGGAEQNRSGAE